MNLQCAFRMETTWLSKEVIKWLTHLQVDAFMRRSDFCINYLYYVSFRLQYPPWLRITQLQQPCLLKISGQE